MVTLELVYFLVIRLIGADELCMDITKSDYALLADLEQKNFSRPPFDPSILHFSDINTQSFLEILDGQLIHTIRQNIQNQGSADTFWARVRLLSTVKKIKFLPFKISCYHNNDEGFVLLEKFDHIGPFSITYATMSISELRLYLFNLISIFLAIENKGMTICGTIARWGVWRGDATKPAILEWDKFVEVGKLCYLNAQSDKNIYEITADNIFTHPSGTVYIIVSAQRIWNYYEVIAQMKEVVTTLWLNGSSIGQKDKKFLEKLDKKLSALKEDAKKNNLSVPLWNLLMDKIEKILSTK